MKRLLTPDQTAELLAVSPKVIRAWLRDGKIPGIRLGRLWRVDPEELEKAIRQGFGKPLQERKGTPQRKTPAGSARSTRKAKKRAQRRSVKVASKKPRRKR